MCRCAERRAALAAVKQALEHGQTASAVEAAKFIGVSLVEDARAAVAPRLAAARRTLARR